MIRPLAQRHIGAGITLTLAAAAFLPAPGCSRREAGPPVYSGTIEAVEVDVAPEISGRILERPVDEGDQVKAGDTIAVIDPEPYRIALAQTEAALAEAKARTSLLAAGYRQEEIAAAAREVDEAQAQLDLALAQVRRVERLVSESVAAQEDMDRAQRDREVAQARLAAARARHDLVSRGYRREEVDQARAEVAGLEALAERGRLDIARSTVRSPLAGTVTAKLQEPGEWVQPGQPIVTVADLANMYTWVYPSIVEVERIRIGYEVSVRIDAYPGKDFPGKVVYISPQAEFTPKNVQTVEDRVQQVFGVKVAVANPDGALTIGIPADVALRRAASP